MSVPTTGEFKIIIQMPSETGAINNETPSPASPQHIDNSSGNPTEGDKNGQSKLALAIGVAKDIGKQGLKAAVSNIGLATGNYYAQQQAQRAISAGQSLAGLAMAFNNPVTAVVSLAGMAISAGSELYQQNKEREIANYQAAQYAKRLGYTRGRA